MIGWNSGIVPFSYVDSALNMYRAYEQIAFLTILGGFSFASIKK